MDRAHQAALKWTFPAWFVGAAALFGGISPAADFVAERDSMVDKEIVGAGVRDPRVIQSMRDTPRHEFVDARQRPNAYFDMALPIGNSQTISPPFIVAYMTEQLLPQPTDKVLEIGTGSGYQAAVLSPLVKEVYSIEIVKPLGEKAERTLKRLKYTNVFTKVGDGYQGWEEHAPFDKIIVTCSPEKVPPKLVEQLREGGRMLVPVGERYQQTLFLFEKKNGELVKSALLPMLFVPMTGLAEASRVVQPDPTRPEVHNGGFEEVARTEGGEDEPAVWHYQRQLKLVESNLAPEGKRYLSFSNLEQGRGAQALQGMAVDGRKVSRLAVSLWVRANNVQPGQVIEQQPVLALTFYDDGQAQVGYQWIGPWRGTFDWRHIEETIQVPPRARVAILRLGMSGATGEIAFDDVKVAPTK